MSNNKRKRQIEDGEYHTPKYNKRVCDVAIDCHGRVILVFKVGTDKDGNPIIDEVYIGDFVRQVMYIASRIR